jgi:hypothetical protein
MDEHPHKAEAWLTCYFFHFSAAFLFLFHCLKNTCHERTAAISPSKGESASARNHRTALRIE